MGIATLNELFFKSAAAVRRPDRLISRRETLSTDEVVQRVRRLSIALGLLGIKPGDRVAILSYNRPEWALADYAILTAGAVTVPIYSTLPRDQVEFILRDSGARAIFVEDAAQAQKVSAVSTLEHRIGFHGPGPGILSFTEVLHRGVSGTEQDHRRRADAVKPGDLATLIYTSGTTGVPKGVMLTHANLASNVEATTQVLFMDPNDRALSFLPLSHVFERMVDYVYFHRGAAIAYAASIDALGDELAAFRPTIFCTVPRVLEKIRERIQKTVAALPERRRKIFDRAVATAHETLERRRRGEAAGFGLSMRHAWYDWLIHSKIRGRLGGRLRVVISGGAALPPALGEFFTAIGVPVLQGYGLTETSPVIALNSADHNRVGTVGKLLPGVEARIAGDGEILVRGPNVMAGYWKKPDDTAAVLKDGWFATGDIGELDADGFLKITDRKKDLLKTSGGKYIAPQPIESALKAHPLVSTAVVVGDGRKFAAALIVPNRDAIGARAAAEGVPPDSPAVRAWFDEIVAAVNAKLAPFETIKKFALLESEFTIDSGELTPTLKVRRRVVDARYRSIIDSLYSDEA